MEAIYSAIGSDPRTILWWQMCIRAVLIFIYALILIRIGSTRAFGKNASLDIVIAVVLGSILSRALTANARFFPTLAAGATLVLAHLVLSKLILRSRTLGHLIKGVEILLVRNGEIQWDGMRKASVTLHDLKEGIRSGKGVADLSKVRAAYMERNGQISVITE